MRHVLNKPRVSAYCCELVMFLGFEFSRIVDIRIVNGQTRDQESAGVSQDQIAYSSEQKLKL